MAVSSVKTLEGLTQWFEDMCQRITIPLKLNPCHLFDQHLLTSKNVLILQSTGLHSHYHTSSLRR